VVDGGGNPVSGASILLNGADLRTTGANGKLSAPYTNVTPPYNLSVTFSGNVFEYQGLQRANPQISQFGTQKNTTIAGNVSGTTYPLPAGTGILIGSSNNTYTSLLVANSATGNYGPANIFWSGADNTTADLVALKYTFTGAAFTSFSQSGKRSGVALQKGVGSTGLNITLDSAVASQDATLTYNAGAYTAITGGGLWNFKVDTATFYLFGLVSIPNGGSTKMPSAGGSFYLTGNDAGGNKALIVAPAVLGGSTNINFPAATVLKNSVPTNGQTAVSKTPTLGWAPVSGATLYEVLLTGGAKTYRFYLPGTASSFTVPSYAAISAGLLGTTNYSWSVQGWKGTGLTPDNLTDAANGNQITLFYGASAVELYSSANTTFTTAP
jgi:hypothetical protein